MLGDGSCPGLFVWVNYIFACWDRPAFAVQSVFCVSGGEIKYEKQDDFAAERNCASAALRLENIHRLWPSSPLCLSTRRWEQTACESCKSRAAAHVFCFEIASALPQLSAHLFWLIHPVPLARFFHRLHLCCHTVSWACCLARFPVKKIAVNQVSEAH